MTVLTRRRFGIALAGGAGALVLGFYWRGRHRDPRVLRGPAADGDINAWLTILPDDRVVLRVAKAEMGQGVLTSLAMIIAEELECRWHDVHVEAADVNLSVRANDYYGPFRTDGSASVRGSRRMLQQVGAHARECLVRAAAKRWNLPRDECLAHDGQVAHAATGRSLRYGALVADAARVARDDIPITLKDPSQFRLLGQPLPRVDNLPKVNGEAVYGIDVRPPGLMHAAVMHCPVLGGTVRRIDAAAATNGVQVFALSDAVVAVAAGHWQARRALEHVTVEWDFGKGETISTTTLRGQLLAALEEPGAVAETRGDALAAMGSRQDVLTATYDVPYLAHACMEPMNCTAWVTADRARIWVGTQDPEAVLALARSITGLAADRIEVHPQWMGGGFGRRVATDHVAEALLIARRVGRPVQLLWTREQDIRRGYYRPMAACKLSARMAGGAPTALVVRVATDSIFAKHRPQDLRDGIDPTSTMALTGMPYAWDHVRIESRDIPSAVPTWFWRSVGASQNAFALESFIDELAAHAGTHPLALRRRLLQGQPRHLAVLAALEERAGVQQPLPSGRGRGIAIHEYAHTVVGQAIEVAVTPAGELTVERVVAVVDCGHVVNPRIVEQQIEGGIVFGLAAARYGEITIEGGRVREGNFDTYRVMTMRDCPPIETHLLPGGGEVWGGAGEPGVPPAAPALCNAIHAATGKRIRSLPVARYDLSWNDSQARS